MVPQDEPTYEEMSYYDRLSMNQLDMNLNGGTNAVSSTLMDTFDQQFNSLVS